MIQLDVRTTSANRGLEAKARPCWQHIGAGRPPVMRFGPDGEHTEFLITLADIGTGHFFRALEAGTQLLGRLTPGHGFETALEDVYELLDSGQLGPDGPVDPAVWEKRFEGHRQIMVSLRNLSAPGD